MHREKMVDRCYDIRYLRNIACLEVLKMLVAEIIHFTAFTEAEELILILNELTTQRSPVQTDI